MLARMTKWSVRAAAALVVASLFACASAFAQTRYQPKVSLAVARTTALRTVAGAVAAEELEHEGGRWIYSFEIRPTGETRKIIKEVNVDADRGVVVSVQIERE